MPTDLQKKYELRQDLRLLTLIDEELAKVKSEVDALVIRLLQERIEDIQKTLED